MAFQDLVDIGTFLDSSNQRESVQDALGVMGLFRQLGVLTTRYCSYGGTTLSADTDETGK